MCVRVCDIGFIVFTDCESCTRPISTNPVSMEAGEYGLTHDTCFFARRLEVVGFAGLLRLRGVFWAGWIFSCCFFSNFFFFEHTRPTASTRPLLASFTSLLVSPRSTFSGGGLYENQLVWYEILKFFRKTVFFFHAEISTRWWRVLCSGLVWSECGVVLCFFG